MEILYDRNKLMKMKEDPRNGEEGREHDDVYLNLNAIHA